MKALVKGRLIKDADRVLACSILMQGGQIYFSGIVAAAMKKLVCCHHFNVIHINIVIMLHTVIYQDVYPLVGSYIGTHVPISIKWILLDNMHDNQKGNSTNNFISVHNYMPSTGRWNIADSDVQSYSPNLL